MPHPLLYLQEYFYLIFLHKAFSCDQGERTQRGEPRVWWSWKTFQCIYHTAPIAWPTLAIPPDKMCFLQTLSTAQILPGIPHGFPGNVLLPAGQEQESWAAKRHLQTPKAGTQHFQHLSCSYCLSTSVLDPKASHRAAVTSQLPQPSLFPKSCWDPSMSACSKDDHLAHNCIHGKKYTKRGTNQL